MKPFCKYIHSKIFVHLLFYFLYWYLLWLYVFIVGPCCFFVYYYSSNGNLRVPIKHWKSDLAKNYDVIDEISDYHEHLLSISAISISVYSVCLCMYNYYVHVHTHKIDSTSSVNQKLGTIFFLLFKTFHTCIFVTKNEFFIFFFLKNNFYCYSCFL